MFLLYFCSDKLLNVYLMNKQFLMSLALFAMFSMTTLADQNWGGFFPNIII